MGVEVSGEERSRNHRYLLLYIVILLFWFYDVF
jgi:hypothetical protein